MKAYALKAVAAVFVAYIIAVIWFGITSYNEIERKRAIVNEARNLIGECRKLGETPISMRGKCLVWDVTDDFYSGAHHILPEELKADSSDDPLTVFLVLPERNESVGRYSVSDEPGYRQYVDVCVVYWPEKKAVGMHSVVSKHPRMFRPVKYSPEYGNPDEPVARWINTLPRER